jgi:hypothetical protein
MRPSTEDDRAVRADAARSHRARPDQYRPCRRLLIVSRQTLAVAEPAIFELDVVPAGVRMLNAGIGLGSLGDGDRADDQDHHHRQSHKRHPGDSERGPGWSHCDGHEDERQRRQEQQKDQEGDAQDPGHGAMIRTAFLMGRILAALGAILMVATIVVTMVFYSSAGNCPEPDCDDAARERAILRGALIFMPISVFVGAAGVALVYDTYRKV